MKKIILFLTVAVLVFVAASCGKEDNIHIDPDEIETTEVEETTTDQEQEQTYNFYESEEKVYEVDNKYCSLCFPEKWKDKVEVTAYDSDAGYTVSFSAVFGSDKVPLYNIVFGESTEGYLLGTINTEKGEQTVYVEDRSYLYDGQLSEKNESEYYDMCEGLNDIISNLVYSEGLTLAE